MIFYQKKMKNYKVSLQIKNLNFKIYVFFYLFFANKNLLQENTFNEEKQQYLCDFNKLQQHFQSQNLQIKDLEQESLDLKLENNFLKDKLNLEEQIQNQLKNDNFSLQKQLTENQKETAKYYGELIQERKLIHNMNINKGFSFEIENIDNSSNILQLQQELFNEKEKRVQYETEIAVLKKEIEDKMPFLKQKKKDFELLFQNFNTSKMKLASSLKLNSHLSQELKDFKERYLIMSKQEHISLSKIHIYENRIALLLFLNNKLKEHIKLFSPQPILDELEEKQIQSYLLQVQKKQNNIEEGEMEEFTHFSNILDIVSQNGIMTSELMRLRLESKNNISLQQFEEYKVLLQNKEKQNIELQKQLEDLQQRLVQLEEFDQIKSILLREKHNEDNKKEINVEEQFNKGKEIIENYTRLTLEYKEVQSKLGSFLQNEQQWIYEKQLLNQQKKMLEEQLNIQKTICQTKNEQNNKISDKLFSAQQEILQLKSDLKSCEAGAPNKRDFQLLQSQKEFYQKQSQITHLMLEKSINEKKQIFQGFVEEQQKCQEYLEKVQDLEKKYDLERSNLQNQLDFLENNSKIQTINFNLAMKEKENQLQQLSGEINKLAKEIEISSQILKEKEAKIEILQIQLQSHEGSNNVELNELEQNLFSSEIFVDSDQQQGMYLQNLEKVYSQKFNELQKEVEKYKNLSEKIKDLKQEAQYNQNNMQEQINQLQKQKEMHEMQQQEFLIQIDQANSIIAKQKEQLINYSVVENQQIEINNLKQNNQELQEQVIIFQNKFLKKKQAINQFINQNQQQQQQISALEFEKLELQGKIEAIEHESQDKIKKQDTIFELIQSQSQFYKQNLEENYKEKQEMLDFFLSKQEHMESSQNSQDLLKIKLQKAQIQLIYCQKELIHLKFVHNLQSSELYQLKQQIQLQKSYDENQENETQENQENETQENYQLEIDKLLNQINDKNELINNLQKEIQSLKLQLQLYQSEKSSQYFSFVEQQQYNENKLTEEEIALINQLIKERNLLGSLKSCQIMLESYHQYLQN